MKFKKYKLILPFLLLSFLFVGLKFIAKPLIAQDNNISDAIAIRVLPNPEHYGIQTWYKKQGFLGSPQSLIVDGYEAIRDGRTVYVAASNVSDPGANTKKIYTNIYLISYNQEIEIETADILGQIISNWSFNKNISNQLGYCSISTITCSEDKDCPGALVCGNNSDEFSFQNNKCVIEEEGNDFSKTKKCLIDSECASGFYCSSLKARVTRDVIRLGRLSDIAAHIEDYNYINGSYPTLRAGSYIPNFSLSVWPSWTNVLANDVGFSPTLIDPINKLGSCIKENAKYDLKTCWNEKTTEFYDNNGLDVLDLPDNSFIYAYKGAFDGSKYALCANMETPDYSFGDGLEMSSFCQGKLFYGGVGGNNAPQLIGYSLKGEVGQVFSGEIEVIDLDGEILNWSISSSDDFSSWDKGEIPKLITTHNPNKRILYSEKAGGAGDYNVNLLVKDGHGGQIEEDLTISITDQGPQIQAENIDYIFKNSGGTKLNYSAYIYDDNLLSINHSELYTLIVNYPEDFPEPKEKIVHKTGDIGHGLNQEMIKIADNKYELKITGLLGDTNNDGEVDENSSDLGLGSSGGDIIDFKLIVQDQSELLGEKYFSINILHDVPIFNISCPETLRVSDVYTNNYNCYIELENQTEETNISFSYKTRGKNETSWSDEMEGLPNNFIFNKDTGLLQGYSKENKDIKFIIKAINEVGASSETEFEVVVNNYCGDGSLQLPNNEFKGGVYDDGFEQCDHEEGLPFSLKDSYDDGKYYKCLTFQNTLFPIPTGSCLFDVDAGKCGDGIVQKVTNMENISEECDFGSNNICCNNCKWDILGDEATDTLTLNFYNIKKEWEGEEIKLDKEGEIYIKTPDAIYVDDEASFDIEIIPEFFPISVEFLIEKSIYMDHPHPLSKPNGYERAKLIIFGLDEDNVLSNEEDSILYNLKNQAQKSSGLINVGVTFYSNPSAASAGMYPLEADHEFCDIGEETCYNKLLEIAKDCNLSDGDLNLNNAMLYASSLLEDEPLDNKKNIVFFGSGRIQGSYPENTIKGIKENDKINIYTVSSPLDKDDCKYDEYQNNCCKLSSDYGDPYNISNCNDNYCLKWASSDCEEREYSFLSPYYYNEKSLGPSLRNVALNIAKSLTKSNLRYPQDITINNEKYSYLTSELGGNFTKKDYEINLNDMIGVDGSGGHGEFSCDPSTAICTPEFLEIVLKWGNESAGYIKLSNFKVNAIESFASCENTRPDDPSNGGGAYTE